MKLALTPFLITTLISTTLPFSSAIVNPCGFVAQAARSRGADGTDGRDGREGRDGAAGSDRTLRATEGPTTINIQGKDGTDGTDGTNATNARCNFFHTEPEYDLEAADGGNGGDGGRGGDGGDGGRLTVYYQDPTQLRDIAVDAGGGEGGRGGRGGLGTPGCDCYPEDWSVTTCEDGNCESEAYECRPGTDGRYGRDGGDGETGKMGVAWLVKQSETLLPDNPEEVRAIADFPNTPVSLSRNLWETRTGALNVFSPGSVISDEYQEYTGRVEQQFQLEWAAERPPSDLSGTVDIAIDEQGSVQVEPVEELWIDSTLSTEGDLTTYRVNGAIVASEATRLALGRNTGSGDQLTLNILDLAGASDLVDTRFSLRYRTNTGDRRPLYVTRYEDEIPSELITREYNRFILPVGQLPIRSEYLRAGTDATVELVVTRSYVGNSAQQTLNWNGRL